jgi:type I restriction enzyme, S subunit
MGGWITEELSKHITFVDYRGKTPTKVDSGMRLITAKNVKMGFINVEPQEFVNPDIYDEWMTRGIPKKGDVLFTTEAPLGNVGQLDVDGKVVIGQRLITMQPDNEVIDSTFLKYALLSPQLQDEIQSRGTGATVLGIKAKLLKQIPFSYPIIPEQKRIVAILDQAFADIEQAHDKTEQNLKNARELFESYLQQVFSQRGEGWVVSKLVDIAEVIDSLHKTPKYSEEGFPMVRVTDVRSGALDLSNTRKVDEDTYEEFSKRYKAKIGDIVFSRVGSYGRSSIVTTDEQFCLGQNTVFLAPSIDGYYFYYFLNSPNAKDQIDKLVSGSTQPTVSLKSIKAIEIPVPPVDVQASIVKELDAMHLKTSSVEAIYISKLEKLDELKKSILQKAFSGELTKTPDNETSKGAAV